MHIGRGQLAVVLANKGFVKQFSEVVMRSAEATVEDTCQGGFGVAAVGGGMTAAVTPDEGDELKVESSPSVERRFAPSGKLKVLQAWSVASRRAESLK